MFSKPFRLQNVREINEFMFKFDELSAADFLPNFQTRIADFRQFGCQRRRHAKTEKFVVGNFARFGESQAHVMSPKKARFAP